MDKNIFKHNSNQAKNTLLVISDLENTESLKYRKIINKKNIFNYYTQVKLVSL